MANSNKVLDITLSLLAIYSLVLGSSALNCHRCSNFYPEYSFPGCLTLDEQCDGSHSCLFVYSDAGPTIASTLTSACSVPCYQLHGITGATCKGGGKRLATGKCFVCCDTNQCVRQFTDSIQQVDLPTILPSRNKVACPASCPLDDDFDSCWFQGSSCRDHNFCAITFDASAKSILGTCAAPTQMSTCVAYNTQHHCPFDLPEAKRFLDKNPNIRGVCYFGCCADDNCVRSAFGEATTTPATTAAATTETLTSKKTMTTTMTTTTATTSTTASTTKLTTPLTQPSPATSPPPPPPTTAASTTFVVTTTPNPTTLSPTPVLEALAAFNVSILMNECKDHMSSSTCLILRDAKDVCRYSYALTLCPETCGICQQVASTNCIDLATPTDCHDVINGIDCSDPLAIFTCAKSCDLCDEVVRHIVKDALSASPIPDFDKTTTPTTPKPFLHCDDLVTLACVHVKAICDGTNLHDVCPLRCQHCSK